MRTGETGIRVTLVVAAMIETDEIQVGEMEREKNAIDTTRTKGTVKGAKMVSVIHRGKARGTFGRIPNPERRESSRHHNYKVCPVLMPLQLTDF